MLSLTDTLPNCLKIDTKDVTIRIVLFKFSLIIFYVQQYKKTLNYSSIFLKYVGQRCNNSFLWYIEFAKLSHIRIFNTMQYFFVSQLEYLNSSLVPHSSEKKRFMLDVMAQRIVT